MRAASVVVFWTGCVTPGTASGGVSATPRGNGLSLVLRSVGVVLVLLPAAALTVAEVAFWIAVAGL